MKKDKPRISVNVESLFIGDEPTWGDKNEISVPRALSWYANQKDWKDSKKYAIDYAKSEKFAKSDLEKLSSSSEDLFKNLGFVCRMKSRGADLDKDVWIKERFAEILNFDVNSVIISSIAAQTVNKPVKVEKSIQDRVWEQATIYINEIEGRVDEFIKTRSSKFKCYDWLVSNSVKPTYMKQIQDHYTPLLEELSLAVSKSDDQLVESYSHWSKKELNSFISFISGIITDCENYTGNTKTVRKTRKKKVVPADKKVSKLQYKKEDTEYKIASVDPAQIIGAKQLWVFNVKYKKLGVYNSVDDSGFGVRGSTLEGFDANTSICKTLRKPLDFLPIVTKGKKVELRKLMATINSKESELTGRLNSDTVLLKVVS
jgi:hypothetical protein